jgi:hypothetical protein
MITRKCFTLPKQLIILGKKELSKEMFQPIQNIESFVKPEGGLWASPYTPNKEYVSAWHEWCDGNMDNWLSNDAVIITLKEEAMYYCIDDQDDLQDIVDIVGEQESILNQVSRMKFATYINFEEASKTWDVIYLTENGAWKTHMPMERRHLNLYGWDCESCLIMNWDAIESWEYKKLDIVKEEK